MIAPRRRGPGVPARALNRAVALWVGRWGLPAPVRMLRVHGRRTGALQATPVLILHRTGFRYLVAPRGETDWARNLRAAGWGELMKGRRVERVTATEVHGDERVAAVDAYVRRFGWLNRRFFDVSRGEGREGVRRIAGRHPTFRLGAMVVLAASLALAGPALGARAGYRVSEAALPKNADVARKMLKRAFAHAPPPRRRGPTSPGCSSSTAATCCAAASPRAAARPWRARCGSTRGGTRATSRRAAGSSSATPGASSRPTGRAAAWG